MRLLLALFLTSVAHAQFLPGVDPRMPEPKAVESLPTKEADTSAVGTGVVVCKRLNEIRLEARSGGELVQITTGFSVAADLPVPSPATLGFKLTPWKGRSLKEGDLIAIADTILVHYDVEGYPVVGIDAPEQDLETGILRLFVDVGRVGNVGVTRPKYGNPQAITKGLTLRRGDLVRRTQLDEQMSWYGRSVFRRPQLLVSPGSEAATADILIGLGETKPWRATLGYENSGPYLLGEDRLILGVAGMTNNEHILALQTVVGLPVSTLQAYALSWEIPFHSIHQSLQLDAVYAEVLTDSTLGGLPVENTGTSWSMAAIQKLSLPTLGKWRQRLAIGVEVKATNQFVLFGGAPYSPGEVRLVQGRLNYGLARDWENGGFWVDTTLLGAPGGVIPGNDDEDFQIYDPEALANYGIMRMATQGWWSLGGDWRIALRGTGQVTNTRLLPVEQFAAGGYQTVRGVTEREYYADNGWQTSLELYAPAITIRGRYQMRFLSFYDQAMLKNCGEDASWLSSAGLGMRFKMADKVDLRVDHGWRIDDQGSQVHIGIQITY
ncbi:MAG: ShlB/FhaC/HecB family hemolysin secretion/activation protein [Armatimonadetes bacterium]|nr:ShlB/FhaC/HecB family hemolysin secretion/activation protein [Akkermansiaceae bacterium]